VVDAVPLVQGRGNRLAVVVLLCLLVGSAIGSIAPDAVKDVGPLLLVAGHTTAGILFLTRARMFGTRDARAWKTLGVALFFGAGGVLLVGALTVAGVDLPTFGPPDLVFLIGYIAVVRALVLLARNSEEGGQSWKVTLIDTAVGAVALSIFVWIGIGHGLIHTLSQADTWSKIMAPLYPVVDVAMLLGVMAMALRRSASRLDPRLMVMAAGLGIQVLADLSFFAEGIGQSFSAVSPRIELFLLASACYVTVGIMARKPRVTREYPERTVSVFALVWPYTLGAGVIVLHVSSLIRLGIPLDEQVTLIGSVAVGLLVTVRQTLAIRAMQSRVEGQRRELISSVSHELRTPLTGLIGYLGLLAGEPGHFSETERQEMIEVASAEASHLGRIITDMVAMARNDGKDLPINVGATTLDAI
jgi:signal transduction histidine kinase